MAIFSILVDNCRFYAHHGLFEEESTVGAAFEVSVKADFEEIGPISNMNQTVNYVSIFEIVQKHFQTPRHLLETLAQEIAEEIHANDPRIFYIEITLKKLNPPIQNFTGTVGITYKKTF
jgi:dihydroneopterin aldolase